MSSMDLNTISDLVSFISGCAATYALSYLFQHFRESDSDRRKIGMLNCLLDRLLLYAKIQELDAKILEDKKSENSIQDNICNVRHKINEVQDSSDDPPLKDSKVVNLRAEEDALLDDLVCIQGEIEENTIELEEMRERYDTLSEISTMEATGMNFDKVLEEKTQEYRSQISKLTESIECKKNYIQRLESMVTIKPASDDKDSDSDVDRLTAHDLFPGLRPQGGIDEYREEVAHLTDTIKMLDDTLQKKNNKILHLENVVKTGEIYINKLKGDAGLLDTIDVDEHNKQIAELRDSIDDKDNYIKNLEASSTYWENIAQGVKNDGLTARRSTHSSN